MALLSKSPHFQGLSAVSWYQLLQNKPHLQPTSQHQHHHHHHHHRLSSHPTTTSETASTAAGVFPTHRRRCRCLTEVLEFTSEEIKATVTTRRRKTLEINQKDIFVELFVSIWVLRSLRVLCDSLQQCQCTARAVEGNGDGKMESSSNWWGNYQRRAVAVQNESRVMYSSCGTVGQELKVCNRRLTIWQIIRSCWHGKVWETRNTDAIEVMSLFPATISHTFPW